MHGIVRPQVPVQRGRGAGGLPTRLLGAVRRNRAFFLIVILPTLIAAVYFGLIAANQYESSADFIVRRSDTAATGSNMGQILGFNFGESATGPDAVLVQEYLLSHDTVAQLAAHDDLVGLFRRPEADALSELWSTRPSPERLLAYYRRHVDVEGDESSGIMHLTVHSFRPADSFHLARRLLDMGEQQINAINDRTYRDNVAAAQREVAQTRAQLAAIQVRLTNYRRTNRDVDPTSTGQAQLTLVTGLTGNLVDARARLAAMEGTISHASPQYRAMARQVAALEGQVAGQTTKIAGPNQSVANRLSDYEQLVVQRDEIAKVYSDAAVRAQAAQEEARRKQLYLIRLVEPNMPVKAEFPKRLQMVASVFVGLFLAYGIGWLLWAGVKEHGM